jgi:hypothetical protein
MRDRRVVLAVAGLALVALAARHPTADFKRSGTTQDAGCGGFRAGRCLGALYLDGEPAALKRTTILGAHP